MQACLFTNVSIFDGQRNGLYPGEVLIEGGDIRTVATGADRISRDSGAEVVDGGGATLMPGMVEGHAHITYPFSVSRRPDVSLMDALMGKIPPEVQTLIGVHNAGVLLQSGFTSAYSAGGATMAMESAVKAEIESGWAPGPRFRASGNEGLPENRDHPPGEILHRAASAAEIEQFIQQSAETGVDIVKFLLSGPGPAGPSDNSAMYTDDLLKVAGERAREAGLWLSGHSRPAVAIKQGLRHGWRVLYHCDGVDEETLDLMEARKDDIFIGPSIGGPVALWQEALARGHDGGLGANPFDPHHDLKSEVEKQAWNCRSMLDRGVRLLLGGDYGFPNLPHGHNARDLGYYVKYMGLTSFEALQTATKWGGELMDMPVGLIKPGYHADLLLVDGDPLSDVELLAQPDKLLVVMKGGSVMKGQLDATPGRVPAIA